jgi:hypothetical protein
LTTQRASDEARGGASYDLSFFDASGSPVAPICMNGFRQSGPPWVDNTADPAAIAFASLPCEWEALSALDSRY